MRVSKLKQYNFTGVTLSSVCMFYRKPNEKESLQGKQGKDIGTG